MAVPLLGSYKDKEVDNFLKAYGWYRKNKMGRGI